MGPAEVNASPGSFFTLFVLYLDESGYHAQADYFVLAGLAVFERELYWFAQGMRYNVGP